MQLPDALSKHPSKEYLQVDGFLQNKRGMTGQNADISMGRIALNFFCKNCGASLPAWFLVESRNDMTGSAPEVRIIKKNARLSGNIKNASRYGEYSMLLDKAELAYQEGLGAGTIVYLRKT